MSELDDLMSLDPFLLTSQDLDKIILGVRQHRARLAGGVKVTKEKGTGPKIDLAAIGLGKKVEPTAPVSRRRVT